MTGDAEPPRELDGPLDGLLDSSRDRTERALAALLAIAADDAAAVRERSPGRRRPRPRYGPALDLGETVATTTTRTTGGSAKPTA